MPRRSYDPGDDPEMNPQRQERDRDGNDVRALRARVNELEREVTMLGRALAGTPPVQQDETSSPAGQRDVRWHCQKCGYLLAFYDMEHDVMRTRYKEHIVFMRAGEGGFIQIVCRGCSEVNTQKYTSPDDMPSAAAQ